MKKGFTLLEILLVIAAIGILAAIVIVAINPNRQLSQVRDTQRRSDSNNLQKALEQYLIDTGSYPTGTTTAAQEVCDTGSNGVGEGTVNAGCLDLRPLVPTYLAAIPSDPSDSATETGYLVWVSSQNNKIAIVSQETELDPLVTINSENAPSDDDLLVHLDASIAESYPGTGNTWFDLTTNDNDFSLVNTSFITYQGDSIEFNRNMPPASESGGYAQLTGSGPLTSPNYLYNNHSTEVWVRINDLDPTNYNEEEHSSAILVYLGWHSMFYFNETIMIYQLWDSDQSQENSIFPFGQDTVEEGEWMQLLTVRDGDEVRTYLNGVLQVTESIDDPLTHLGSVTNTIRIGMGNNSGASYSFHADMNVGVVRMYNRALSPAEVYQNYASHKNRYGI